MDAPAVGTGVDAQIAAEAALGRALMMVQRMEADAVVRAEQASAQRLAAAESEARALTEEARQRAAAIAELTRDAVARVLAEEHTALLEGLTELAELERRLRATVSTSYERIAVVLQDPTQGGSIGSPSTAVASPPTVSPADAQAPLPTSPGIEAPAPMGDLDLDAPVVGADDAFFADLRRAVDGTSSIAGRSDPPAIVPVPMGLVPPPPPPPTAGANPSVALAAAAAAATQAVAEPALLTQPAAPVVPPPLHVVPPIDAPPIAPTAPPPAEPTGVFVPPAAEPTDDAPASTSRRSRAHQRRSRWAMVGTGLRNLGILLLLFVAFQLWGTAALEHRDQARLRHSFQIAVASQPSPSTNVPSGDGTDPATVTPPSTVAAPPPAPSGEAVAVIKIPKIGVEQAVVEGTGVGDLRKGPGHYRNTPLPGQPGNAAIAGHRTTYGAPFNRIDELAPGDAILVTTLQGNFKYLVSEAPFPVSPRQNDVLFPKNDNRITLTTCHPKYSAEKRLIVVAKLAPRVKPAAAPKVSKTPRKIASVDASTAGDTGAALPALMWAALVGAAYFGMVWLSRRWVRRAALLIGVPIILALLFPFFEQLSRLLPANY